MFLLFSQKKTIAQNAKKLYIVSIKCMSSRGSQQDLREGSPDRSTLGRKQRFVINV